MEEMIKVVEGSNLYGPIKAGKMCLVLNVIVLRDFQVPEFVKYTQCMLTLLETYYNKMAYVVHDEKLLIYLL